MKIRLWLLVCALLGAGATFLPWETYGSLSTDGTLSRGWTSFGAFAATAALALARPTVAIRLLLLVASIVAMSAAAIKIGHLGAAKHELEQWPASRKDAELLAVGTGVWVVIAASFGVLFGALLWRRPRPGQPRRADLPRVRLVDG